MYATVLLGQSVSSDSGREKFVEVKISLKPLANIGFPFSFELPMTFVH